MCAMVTDEILLKPYLEHLWRKRWVILFAVVALTGLALGVAWVLPPKYRAVAVIVVPGQGSSGSVGAALSGATSPLSVLHGIARSAAIMRPVATEMGMKLDDLRQAVDVEEDPVFSQLKIVAVTGSKAKSERIVTAVLRQLTDVSSSVSLTIGADQAKELQRALMRKESELLEAQKRFTAFQSVIKNVPDPNNPLINTENLKQLRLVEFDLGRTNEQLKFARETAKKLGQSAGEIPAGIPNLDYWRNQVVQLQFELGLTLVKYGDKNPEVLEKRGQIEAAKKNFAEELSKYMESIDLKIDPRLAELESARIALEWQRDYLRELTRDAPNEALQYARLKAEVDAQTRAADAIRAQLEEAKVTGEVYKQNWTILQNATAEGVAVNKKYPLIGFIGVMSSLIFCVAVTCIAFGWRQGRAERK